MNALTAILIGAISLSTAHDEIPDGTTVGEILSIGGYNATNAAEYVVAKYDETNLSSRINAKYTKPANGIPMTDLKSDLQNTIYGKQDALSSGVNIKTLNNQSILGAGNMTVTAVAPIEKIYTNGSEVVVGQDRIARIAFPTGGGGSGGIDTNAVKDIVNEEVGGTNTLVHSDAAWVITATNQAANARDRLDNVCHTNSETWTASNVPEGVTMVGEPYVDAEGWLTWLATGGGVFYGFYFYHGSNPLVPGVYELYEIGGERKMTATLSRAATAGHPFVTYDNIPSTNGFVTASVTNGLESASHASATYAPIVDANDHPVVREDGQVHVWQILAMKSFDADYALCDNLGHTISEYYATVDSVPTIATNSVMNASDLWSESNANLTGTVGRVSAPIATNAAEAVVGEVIEYGLTNLTANTETFELASGLIGNISLDSAHTNINLTLVYPTETDKSADVLLRVVNAADTTLAINSANTDVDGTEWTAVKVGTNYVTATRTAYEGGRSKVLVNVKEVK